MGFNFPATPSVGDVYPTVPTAGIPQYKWNGSAWVNITSLAAGGMLFSDTAPSVATNPDGSLWWNTSSGILYTLYNDGTSRQWVQVTNSPVDPAMYVPASTPVLRYDAQSLTTAQALQARQNIAAAPIEALAESNIVVNSGFSCYQYWGGSTSTFAGTGFQSGWVADSWQTQQNSTASMTTAWAQQGINTAPPGLPNAFGGNVSVVNAAPAAGDYLVHQQWIEPQRIARLQWGTVNALPLTVGFWVRALVPGIYSFSLGDQPGNNRYCTTYTINSANTWEYKTITIPGCTTGSSWLLGTAAGGLYIFFTLMCGSSYRGTPNTWLATPVFCANTAINWAATINNTWMIAGMFMIAGNDAPAADRSPLIIRHTDRELALVQRYFNYFGDLRCFAFNGVPIVGFTIPIMRKVPTVTFAATSYTNANGLVNNSVTVNSLTVSWNITAAGSTSYVITQAFLDARAAP